MFCLLAGVCTHTMFFCSSSRFSPSVETKRCGPATTTLSLASFMIFLDVNFEKLKMGSDCFILRGGRLLSGAHLIFNGTTFKSNTAVYHADVGAGGAIRSSGGMGVVQADFV